jgi:hypothetical protein
MPYALFDQDQQVGDSKPTALEVWKQALEAGLISDIPAADEVDEQILPPGFKIKEVTEALEPRLE